jgi:hypothetical protein
MTPDYQAQQQNIYMASVQQHMRDEWQGTSADRRGYKAVMKDWRAQHGLVDGLRTDEAGFAAYLAKRRAEDAQRRPGGR